GPTITIRKFPRLLGLADLVRIGALSESAARFLSAAVAARANVIVSGGTGSGKTTLLNALSEFIPDNERIVTIEDTAELQLRRTHVVALQARPAIRGQIASALHLIVHVARTEDGRRAIESIAEFEGLTPSDELPVRTLFSRDGEGELRLVTRPAFAARLSRRSQAMLETALPQ